MEKGIIPPSAVKRALVARILGRYFDDWRSFDFKVVGLGIENRTVIVHVNSRRYVIRIYNRTQFGAFRRTASSVLWELDLMEHMRRGGIPVPKVIPTLRGKWVTTVNLGGKKYYVAIFEFVRGRLVRRLTPRQIRAVMICQALLHKRARNFQTRYKRTIDRQYGVEERILRDRDKRISRYPGHTSLLVGLWEVVNHLYPKLSSLIQKRAKYAIHDDLNRENLKFSGDKIVGIFDFDDALMGVPAGELGKTLSFIINKTASPKLIDEQTNKAMAHYSSVIPLGQVARRIARLSFMLSWASRIFILFEGRTKDVRRAQACLRYYKVYATRFRD